MLKRKRNFLKNLFIVCPLCGKKEPSKNKSEFKPCRECKSKSKEENA